MEMAGSESHAKKSSEFSGLQNREKWAEITY